MKPRLLFDAHLDLSYNAVDFNRDLRWPLERIRRHELGRTDHVCRSRGTVCFPEMRRGRIGLCVATQLARHVDPFSRMPGCNSPEQAWAWTQGQHAWHVEMEHAGELRQLRTGAEVAAHAAVWLKADDAEAARLPIGYVLSLEGADSLVSRRHLDTAYGYGLRIVGLTHYGPGVHGQGTDATGPLTPRGRDLLRELRSLGIILDATHLSDASFRDALDHWDGPVWASHSNCRALAAWNRQFDDAQIRELARRGAVIGMAFDAIMMVHGWAHHRSRPEDFQLRLEKIVEHMDHICQLTGTSGHLAIGSDLDGGFGTEQTPMDLDTIADLARLGDLLAGRGYSGDDIEGILWGNAVSFLERHLPS
ncbi:MAG: membrane dipeptidase [Verrucomicrobiae bacterium]|nr:membrane dipeptidase [Verrucomicrobiae bacterium]